MEIKDKKIVCKIIDDVIEKTEEPKFDKIDDIEKFIRYVIRLNKALRKAIQNDEELTDEVKIIGQMNWTSLRQFIISELEDCKTEHQFEFCILKLWKSVGTTDHIQRVRNELGIKPLSEDEMKSEGKDENNK